MSWRLLLSDYPTAILGNELSIIILALLESGGMLSEEELQRKVTVEPAALVKALIGLHADRFVEYSRNRIRVSERGKALLDRFSLHVDILEDMVCHYGFGPDLEHKLKNAISEYRNRSFDQYLDSVSAVRSWSAVCRDGELRANLPADSEASGCLAIWFYDLSDWAKNDPLAVPPPARLTLPAAAGTGKTSLAKIFLNACAAVERRPNPWEALREQTENWTGLFCLHHQSRKTLDKTLFLDEWSTDGELFVHLKSFSRFWDALDSVPGYALQHWATLGEVGLEPSEEGRRSRRDRVLRRQMNEFLTNLLAARTLSELAELTGMSEDSLRVLLGQVRDKCNALSSGERLLEDGGYQQ